MELEKDKRLEERLENGSRFGGAVGLLAGVGLTVYGGYELGTIANDYFNVPNIAGRAALDLFVMGVIAAPVISVSGIGGYISGFILGGISHPIIETTKYISKKLTRKELKKLEQNNYSI